MKPQTPVNIPLLSDLLKTHPNQKFVANLTAGLSQGFWAGYQGNHFSKQPHRLFFKYPRIWHLALTHIYFRSIEDTVMSFRNYIYCCVPSLSINLRFTSTFPWAPRSPFHRWPASLALAPFGPRSHCI